MANERAFADHLLTTFPTLRNVPLRSSYPAAMWGEPIRGTELWAFYRDGALDYVTDLKGGRQYRPTTPEEDAREQMIAGMSAGELAHHFADMEQFRPSSRVYFIGHRDHAIKIGVTVSVTSRFAALQSHSPIRLEVFATRPGGPDRESAYHCQFAEHRLHGEWFAPHAAIFAEIERLQAAA